MKRPIPNRKRLNLNLPRPLYEELEREADRRSLSVTTLLCQSIKLMLFISRLKESPGSALIVRDDDGERELKVIV